MLYSHNYFKAKIEILIFIYNYICILFTNVFNIGDK